MIWSDVTKAHKTLEAQLTAYWKQFKLTYEQGTALRQRAKTDLFFLTKDLLGWNDLTERTHKEVTDFFVQKDPSFPTFKDFAQQYVGKRNRLLLLPRNGFKSVINVSDCVQYIICWPDITMVIITETLELATAFIDELKAHFTLTEDGKLSSMS
jgi:hypothetical protein